MPKKIQNFAKSALVKPITVNVGRAGAASLDVIQEVEYVKQEAKMVYLLECLQKTSPPVSDRKYQGDTPGLPPSYFCGNRSAPPYFLQKQGAWQCVGAQSLLLFLKSVWPPPPHWKFLDLPLNFEIWLQGLRIGCSIWIPHTPCGRFTTSISQREWEFQMD